MTPLTSDFYDFIASHLNEDINALCLKFKGCHHIPNFDFALTQIECRKRTQKKLSDFLLNERFLFPDIISSEQASHQAVAKYHSSFLSKNDEVLDMTAGLGIDVMSMAKKCRKITAFELDEKKADMLNHNLMTFNIENVKVINGDSISHLKDENVKYDVIFVDPARRGEGNVRTYNFKDCQPDILSNLALIKKRAKRILIKASPLLDISQTVKDLDTISSIRVISVENECKEILIGLVGDDYSDNLPDEILYEAIDLDNSGEIKNSLSYRRERACYQDNSLLSYAEERDLKTGYFLYEPLASVMKLSPWQELQERYDNLKKLNPSSHLFVAETEYPDFPGRILRIEKLLEKKDRKSIKGLPANVVVRNYPLTAIELRKQLKVKEGKDTFIYGTRLKLPILILANRSGQSES